MEGNEGNGTEASEVVVESVRERERERLREQESKREHRWFHVLETLPGYAFYEWRIKSNTAATELPDDNHTSTSQQILPTYYHRTPTKATYTCS